MFIRYEGQKGLDYNVAYEYNGETRMYCQNNGTHEEMEDVLIFFKERYLNADGTGKAYPNGKGFYPIRNPRIVKVNLS